VPSQVDVMAENDRVEELIQKIIRKQKLWEIVTGLVSESHDLESSKNVARKIEDSFLETGDKNLIGTLEIVILTHDKNKSSQSKIVRPLLNGLTSIVHGLMHFEKSQFLENFYDGLKKDGAVKFLVNKSKIAGSSYMEFGLSKAMEKQAEDNEYDISPYENMAITFLKNGFEKGTELQGGYTAIELVEEHLPSMSTLKEYLLKES